MDDVSGSNSDEVQAFNAEVRAVLSRLDGTEAKAVEVLTGLDADELAALGGLVEEERR